MSYIDTPYQDTSELIMNELYCRIQKSGRAVRTRKRLERAGVRLRHDSGSPCGAECGF